jgi:hypothetical protein
MIHLTRDAILTGFQLFTLAHRSHSAPARAVFQASPLIRPII